jgi:glutathione S-transferase
MPLKLYMHPLASFCQKALFALYENGTPFEPVLVDLGDEASRAAFLKVWQIGKFPVLRDEARGVTIPESSIVIEYVAQHYPGTAQLIPADADLARETRLQDRYFDLYIADPMQRIVGDRLRPPQSKDAFGVDAARASLKTAYAVLEQQMATRTWAIGDTLSMADCAAAPALFYADKVQPFVQDYPQLAAYYARMQQRPAWMRVMREAEPYLQYFPTS